MIRLLLAFIEHQLDSKMEMHHLNVVGVLLIGIAGAAHKADDIPGIDRISHLQARCKGCILP